MFAPYQARWAPAHAAHCTTSFSTRHRLDPVSEHLMRILLLLLSVLQLATGLNILVFLLGTNQFERNIFEFLAQQLALRHHNVISIKPVLIPEEPRLVKPKLHLVREKVIKNVLSKWVSCCGTLCCPTHLFRHTHVIKGLVQTTGRCGAEYCVESRLRLWQLLGAVLSCT